MACRAADGPGSRAQARRPAPARCSVSGCRGCKAWRATAQGFWQYLETDGWEGPYRLRQEPYYQALGAAAQRDPRILTSEFRAYRFTLTYVRERWAEFTLLVLDNVYRLFERPVNGYRWDYPIGVEWQIWLHRMVVVFALGAVALVGAQRPADLPVFLIPLCLAIVHGLTFPWPRYSQPAIFIVFAAAATFAAALTRASFAGPGTLRIGVSILALGLVLDRVGAGLLLFHPELARGLTLVGMSFVLMSPFAWVILTQGRGWPRLFPVLCGSLLCVTSIAHAARRTDWHETRTRLGEKAKAVEQRIQLSARAASTLRQTTEAFIVFDLHVKSGDPRALSIDVNGRRYPATAMSPTMPRLAESTTTGFRDPRTYRQWWAIPFPKELVTEGAAVEIRIRLEGARMNPPVILFGDRHSAQQHLYEGPSFGEWPTSVALKLEYDGDYRIPARRVIESDSTQSLVVDDSGEMRTVAGIHRIRILAIGSNEGRMSFEGEASSRAQGPVAFAFLAYGGARGEGSLQLQGYRDALRFPLGGSAPLEVEQGLLHLCYRPLGERGGTPYGGYVVSIGRRTGPETPRFDVSFQSGMSVEPMYFSVDTGNPEKLPSLFEACGTPGSVERLSGAVRRVDGTRNSYPDDTGKWSVVSVF